MIEKNLHMLWIGNEPSYIGNVLSAYSSVNPAFDIHYEHADMNHKCSDELEFCIENFLECANGIGYDGTDEIKLKTHQILNHELDGFNMRCLITKALHRNDILPRFYALIADIWRFLVINNYGGIYVDCDSFPIQPFDDDLLSHDVFRVKEDIYFIGQCKDSGFWTINGPNVFNTTPYAGYSLEERQQFFNGTLKYVEKDAADCYICHFNEGTWKA